MASFLSDIGCEYVIPEKSTVAYLLREIIAPKIPEELWEIIEVFAYNRMLPRAMSLEEFGYFLPRAMSLEEFGYFRNKTSPKAPLIRYIENSDYDSVREELARGRQRYPLNTVVKFAKKPWMLHLLLQRGVRVYPSLVYQRALESFAYQGEDKLIDEMGCYAQYISDKSVYRALSQMVRGIKERNNVSEQSHECIQRILANRLGITIQDLLRTIEWAACLKLE